MRNNSKRHRAMPVLTCTAEIFTCCPAADPSKTVLHVHTRSARVQRLPARHFTITTARTARPRRGRNDCLPVTINMRHVTCLCGLSPRRIISIRVDLLRVHVLVVCLVLLIIINITLIPRLCFPFPVPLRLAHFEISNSPYPRCIKRLKSCSLYDAVVLMMIRVICERSKDGAPSTGLRGMPRQLECLNLPGCLVSRYDEARKAALRSYRVVVSVRGCCPLWLADESQTDNTANSTAGQ